jgi:hypothetical protein
MSHDLEENPSQNDDHLNNIDVRGKWVYWWPNPWFTLAAQALATR